MFLVLHIGVYYKELLSKDSTLKTIFSNNSELDFNHEVEFIGKDSLISMVDSVLYKCFPINTGALLYNGHGHNFH